MAYIPDPSDASQPLENVKASTAAAEFRALKQYLIDTTVNGNRRSYKRQTLRSGPSDSDGQPNFLVAGTGLNVNFSGGPIYPSFAYGFDGAGDLDFVTSVTNAVNDVIPSGLLPLNKNYIFLDYQEDGSVVWGKTLVPPVYKQVIPGAGAVKTVAALMNARGVNGATAIYDDYGFLWDLNGAPTISTAQSPYVGGNSVQLDGVTQYIKTTGLDFIQESWTLEGHFRLSALPGAGADFPLLGTQNVGTFGAFVFLNNTAGTRKLKVNLSSNGTANNLAAAALGTSTTWAADTWYHIALSYDARSGNYYLYKDGVLDYTLASTAPICNTATTYIGGPGTLWAGYIAGVRYSVCARYPNGQTFTPPIAMNVPDLDVFCIRDMTLYSAAGTPAASGAADYSHPAKKRLYIGEIITSAVAPTTITLYAYDGIMVFNGFGVAINTVYSKNHNIGVTGFFVKPRVLFRHINANNSWRVGDVLHSDSMMHHENLVTTAGFSLLSRGRNSFILAVANDLKAFRVDTAAADTYLATINCYLSGERTF